MKNKPMDFPPHSKKLTESYFAFLPKPHAKRGQVLVLCSLEREANSSATQVLHCWARTQMISHEAEPPPQGGGSCPLDSSICPNV